MFSFLLILSLQQARLIIKCSLRMLNAISIVRRKKCHQHNYYISNRDLDLISVSVSSLISSLLKCHTHNCFIGTESKTTRKDTLLQHTPHSYKSVFYSQAQSTFPKITCSVWACRYYKTALLDITFHMRPAKKIRCI